MSEQSTGLLAFLLRTIELYKSNYCYPIQIEKEMKRGLNR